MPEYRNTSTTTERAHAAVFAAVRDGSLVPPECCEWCGKTPRAKDGRRALHAHHESYDEGHWLDVVWFCPPCHKRRHAELNADPGATLDLSQMEIPRPKAATPTTVSPPSPCLLSALAVPGMTQARLARLINVSRVTVARWKAGTRTPDNPTLLLLSIIGNVPPTSWPPQLKERWEANLPKRRVVG